MNEYYYEEDYPDCIGEIYSYNKQPACLTCVYKQQCAKEIKEQSLNPSIQNSNYIDY